ncbi:MAG TPA: tripartite tricarboxylate transporter TctB family protein [Burkholderiaceae bacterium]|nr:tripartite tricarboxylate transporter TctB family protein [Burkholderiaceae bacterium]
MTETRGHDRAASGHPVGNDSPAPASPPATGLVKGPTDLAAGLFLLVCAVLGWWFGQPLKVGTAYRMGPGYVPILLSWVMGGFGVLLCTLAFLHRGAALEKWRAKPIVLVLGSLLVFAFTIERTGLLIASTLAVAMAGLASPQQRLRQTVLLAVCLAAFACVLFPLALQLPLRIFP